MLYGGIEAGGTKMVCAVMDDEGKIIDRVSFPTLGKDETLKNMVDYFKGFEIASLGIASFGPIDLNKLSDKYGCILRTPKEGWENVSFVEPFKELGVPIGIDTDVNGAILGEVVYGSAKGCESAIYITIGTGIGVGLYINGGLAHGLMHPEAGHILMTKHPEDKYDGCCKFHKNCFEGLACGPSIQKRWGKPAVELYNESIVWEIESYYIAQAVADYCLCYSPEKVVLWGGVMHQDGLYDMIREKVADILNGYIPLPKDYIIPPSLGEDTGVIGAALIGKALI